MSTIKLFDAFCGFGGASPGARAVVSANELLDEMQRLSIYRSLVRVTPVDLDNDIPVSNHRLYTTHHQAPSLIPCPVVAPNGAKDLLPETDQIDDAIRQGAGAVCIRPGHDYWTLAPWACDALFQALTDRQLPVVCLDSLVSLEQVGILAERYPSLPLLLMQANYRQQRMLLPLLQTFPNVSLSLGYSYAVHMGIEQLCAHIGASRLLFGTGFPLSEPMSAITYLLYAYISTEEKMLIGSGNMERLLEGIR